MKDKDAKSTLEAMKQMFKRKYIKKPFSSIRTDPRQFNQWCYDNDIHQKKA